MANPLDTATGLATFVGNTGISGDGHGLAFSSANVLYTANDFELDLLDQSTGAHTLVVALTYDPAFGEAGESRANGMKFDPSTGTLYASVVNGGKGSQA